jgi:hypothetical protein
MKAKFIFAGIISLALVFGTMMASCDNGTESYVIAEHTYSSSDEDMVIVFKEMGTRAVLESGFLFEIYYDGNIVSSGTIMVSEPTITFRGKGGTFTASISGDIITFNDDIIKDDGGTLTPSGSFSKETQSGDPNPFVGIWNGDDGSVLTVTEDTWRYDGPDANVGGTYTRIGNTATYYFEGQTYPNVTRIINEVFHTQSITFFK